MKLGAARSKAPSAWRLVETDVDKDTGALTYSLDRKKLERSEAAKAIIRCGPI